MSSGAMIRPGSSKLWPRNLRGSSGVPTGARVRARHEGPREPPRAASGAIDEDGSRRAFGVGDHHRRLRRQFAFETGRRVPPAGPSRELVGTEEGKVETNTGDQLWTDGELDGEAAHHARGGRGAPPLGASRAPAGEYARSGRPI